MFSSPYILLPCVLLSRARAATNIQRVYRGMKGRHLAAVMASLRHLHEVEVLAAKKIQTKYRTYRARKFLLLLKMIQAREKYMNRMATRMQKVFRGMRGRQLFEITLCVPAELIEGITIDCRLVCD